MFNREHAHRAVEHIDAPQGVKARLASAAFNAARSYEMRKWPVRNSIIRRELKKLLMALNKPIADRHVNAAVQKILRNLSRSALIYLALEDEEQLETHIEAIRNPLKRTAAATNLKNILKDVIPLLNDPGGRAPPDVPARQLINALMSHYEALLDRESSHGWNDIKGTYVGEFSKFAMLVCHKVTPSLSAAKVDKYIRYIR